MSREQYYDKMIELLDELEDNAPDNLTLSIAADLRKTFHRYTEEIAHWVTGGLI